jgi:hypothetical protein
MSVNRNANAATRTSEVLQQSLTEVVQGEYHPHKGPESTAFGHSAVEFRVGVQTVS